MKRITMVIAGLGGRGHDIYGNYAMEHPDEVEIAAVADPRPERLELAQREWNIPAERCFATAEELFAQPQLADAAVIATQDRQHVVHAEAALKGGYHLLLEKPVAVDIEGCLEVLRLARRYQRHVVVCHVLRYTPFYNAIKRIIEDGRIGEVVTIQAMEQVGYWHQAHSYVRGNWRRADESSPMILAKCCHDMDILIWLTGKRARYVSSYGNNYLFRAEKAPAGAAQRCMDCAVRAGCPYDAVRYYLESGRTSVRAGRVHWPINVLDPHPTPENVNDYLGYDQIFAVGGTWMCKSDVIKAGDWAKITAQSKEAVDTMLGLRLHHVGINTGNEEEAMKVATLLGGLLNMKVAPGNSSIFVGNKEFEIMKKPGRGTNGHIAIACNNVDRAIYHLSQRGVKFDLDSKNVKNGKTIACYFADEIAGFAMHLVQA